MNVRNVEVNAILYALIVVWVTVLIVQEQVKHMICLIINSKHVRFVVAAEIVNTVKVITNKHVLDAGEKDIV